MPAEPLKPAARQFLLQACKYVQEYDEEGSAVVPVTAWPRLLEDLDIEADGQYADFLASFMQEAGDSRISYLPLLEALGFALPDEEVAHRDTGSPGATRLQEPLREQLPRSPGAASENGGDAVSAAALEATGRPRQGSEDGSSYGPELDEDSETFWARRAATIQRLFHLWDCNQLTNEALTAQLQDLLGSRADVTSPDSAFQKLATKHTTARNLKFAHLTSALRQDARATMARRFGNDGASAFGGSSAYEPSEVGSEVSGSASELAARGLAAGRPTTSPPVASLGSAGRRHFHAHHSQLPLGSNAGASVADARPASRCAAGPAAEDWRDAAGRAPPDRREFAGEAERESMAGDTGAPAATGGYFAGDSLGLPGAGAGYPGANGRPDSGAGGYPGGRSGDHSLPLSPEASGTLFASSSPQVPLDTDFWSRTEPDSAAATMMARRCAGAQRADQYDVMSSSDIVSEADSHRSAFTQRNRHGHGNILTWGADSRDITPERKRSGRQQTVDEKHGKLRSQVTQGIFHGGKS